MSDSAGWRAPVAVAVAGLVIIGVGQGVFNRHAIQNTLTRASQSALQQAGVTGASVTFSGRDARIVVAGPQADIERSRVIVEGVHGVRVATVRASGQSSGTAPTAKPATSPTELGVDGIPPVGLTFNNGLVTVSGFVSSDAVDQGIKAILAGAGQWAVVDQLQINASIVQADPNWIRSLAALAAAIPPDTTLMVARFEQGSVIMRGHPQTAALETDILAAAATTVGSHTKVIDGLDVTP